MTHDIFDTMPATLRAELAAIADTPTAAVRQALDALAETHPTEAELLRKAVTFKEAP